MITANGSLTMLNLNTPNAQVFWNGKAIQGLVSVRVDWENDEQRVKLAVTGVDDAAYAEMQASGITIRRK